MQTLLEGKIAIVTGAGQGIGKGIARGLAAQGASILACDLNEKSCAAVAELITKDGGKAAHLAANLCSEDDVANMASTAKATFGRLDIVVNNARPPLKCGPFGETMDQWDLAMDVLLKAPALMAKHCQPIMKETGGGSIVNIGSTNAYFSSHQPAAYHCAKAGLIQLTKYLARDFGPDGIRVNLVSPGLVDILDEDRQLTANADHKTVTEIAVPLGRAGSVEEIAAAVAFLCAEGSAYITGQDIVLDGGITINDHFHVARMALLHEKGK